MANSNTKIESDKKFADIDDELIKNKRHETLEETKIKVETDEPKLVINLDGEVRSGDESELVNKSGDGDTADEGRSGNQRENRLTSIIDQLRGANKLKGYTPREGFSGDASNGEGGGGGARRCARDAAASPAQQQATPLVKTERLSPHDNRSSASRSRSVTPSTSSYPATPPSRGSPHAPPAPAPPAPRNYSDIMRSLAARYNTQHTSDYFHRVNGFGSVEPRPPLQTSPLRVESSETPLGGLFTRFARQQGGPPRLPAFPVMLDMSSTKTLLAISRVGLRGRSRRKRGGAAGAAGAEHSPLDLSAAGETAAKRARLSASPSTRSDDGPGSDDRGSTRGDCLCAEARARLQAWTVDDVADFVTSIDICAEYATNFREQRIDGAGLPLLTEEHLTGMLQMKLGPALKLRAVLARRLEPCAPCNAAAAAANVTPKINGTSLKSEPRSNTTSPS